MSPYEYEGEILMRLPVPLRKEVVLYIHRRFARLKSEASVRHVIQSELLPFKAPLPAWCGTLI